MCTKYVEAFQMNNTQLKSLQTDVKCLKNVFKCPDVGKVLCCR